MLLASATTRLDEVTHLDADGPPGRDRGHPRRLHRRRPPRPPTCCSRRTPTKGDEADRRRPAYVHRGVDDVAVGSRRSASRERPGRVGARGHHADAHRRRGAADLPDLRRYGPRRIAPTLPTVGTGFGTACVPAVNLPDIVLPDARAALARRRRPASGQRHQAEPDRRSRRRADGRSAHRSARRRCRPRCRPRADRPPSLPTGVPHDRRSPPRACPPAGRRPPPWCSRAST